MGSLTFGFGTVITATLVVVLGLYVSAASIDIEKAKVATPLEIKTKKNDVAGIRSRQPVFEVTPTDNKGDSRRDNNVRIISGEEALVGEFPSQISLQIQDGNGNWDHICAGSIVNPTKILTAAHCVKDEYPHRFRVVAGAHNIFRNDGNEQFRNVSQYVYNPRFNATHYNNDIAVITVTSPFEFTPRVQPIRIAEAGVDPSGVCVTCGWGQNDPYSSPETLHKTLLDIIDEKECQRRYVGINEITSGMTCAGRNGGHGACNGDSGGPLICTDSEGTKYLAGAVSWGMTPCGQDQFPTVYANVAHFAQWIEEYI